MKKRDLLLAGTICFGIAAGGGEVLWQDDLNTPETAGNYRLGNGMSFDPAGGIGGGGCLKFHYDKPNGSTANRNLDVAKFQGKRIVLKAMLKAEELKPAGKDYLGPKLTLYVNSPSRKRLWLDQAKEYGSYDWKCFQVMIDVPEDATELALNLGIQQGVGTLWIDDLSISEVERPRERKPTEEEMRAAMVPGLKKPAELKVAGDWQVAVRVEPTDTAPVEAVFDVPPPEVLKVKDEKYTKVLPFNPRNGGWDKGTKLEGVRNGCTTTDALDPATLKLMSAPGGDRITYLPGKDYELDPRWGTFGRIDGSRIGENTLVWADYEFCRQRIDSVILKDGKLGYRKGEAKISLAAAPELEPGEVRVANIFIPTRQPKLEEANFYLLQESRFPLVTAPVADKLLPRTMAKLRNGGKLKILAWGDSVTDGRYVATYELDRWQAQFVKRLKERFPKAEIELITEAWGGRNTSSYLAVPAGQPHNYQETVLAVKPDLVISEFVNDSWLNSPKFGVDYGKFLKDFREIGAEWIVITPHYINSDGMYGAAGQKNIDQDKRAYVELLRSFAAENGLPCADVSARYGRLWRQGIPYLTLMTNHINHPDRRGLAIYADALMEIFPEK